MKVEIRDGKLCVEIEINDPPVDSKSGKTKILCSTRGNIPTDIFYQKQRVYLGVNAYFIPAGENESK